MDKNQLQKVSVDLPLDVYLLIKQASRMRGEFSEIIRKGAENEARTRIAERVPATAPNNRKIKAG